VHGLSRVTSHQASIPMPFDIENCVSVDTSASVNTSGDTSFLPIIGVTPTTALRCALVRAE
jgi:hypothetical protein